MKLFNNFYNLNCFNKENEYSSELFEKKKK